MKKSYLYSALALLLVLATTEFFWFQQLSENGELVETDTEERVELEEEGESHKKSYLLSFDLAGVVSNRDVLSRNVGFNALRTHDLPVYLGENYYRLYILFQQLRLHI